MPNKSTKQKTLSPSTLETVDFALYNWLNEKLDIYTDSNEGRRKVPIIWITAERAFQVKDDKGNLTKAFKPEDKFALRKKADSNIIATVANRILLDTSFEEAEKK